jgi:pantoate kinase
MPVPTGCGLGLSGVKLTPVTGLLDAVNEMTRSASKMALEPLLRAQTKTK